ncbi:hypothetical protein SBRY_30259 [Actinacidiphila bryophytorum]|uniref:Uncharacterized protein n=1 Tax=Actinacidiphila bryophytorum TaxID=1436133 RepID=A0A9W4MEP7_9ACTN|nr:hypothetical protein SBRY_30259 [Actinacidiphila bryophytorum]
MGAPAARACTAAARSAAAGYGICAALCRAAGDRCHERRETRQTAQDADRRRRWRRRTAGRRRRRHAAGAAAAPACGKAPHGGAGTALRGPGGRRGRHRGLQLRRTRPPRPGDSRTPRYAAQPRQPRAARLPRGPRPRRRLLRLPVRRHGRGAARADDARRRPHRAARRPALRPRPGPHRHRRLARARRRPQPHAGRRGGRRTRRRRAGVAAGHPVAPGRRPARRPRLPLLPRRRARGRPPRSGHVPRRPRRGDDRTGPGRTPRHRRGERRMDRGGPRPGGGRLAHPAAGAGDRLRLAGHRRRGPGGRRLRNGQAVAAAHCRAVCRTGKIRWPPPRRCY